MHNAPSPQERGVRTASRATTAVSTTIVAELQRETALLALLRISPVESWQARTPALRRLLARARVATVRNALAAAAAPPPTLRPAWPLEIAAMAIGARDALLEAILVPLACANPAQRPDARRRLRLAIALMQIPVEARAAWRDVERLGGRAPADLQHAWGIAVCALLRVDAEGWRHAAAARLRPETLLAEIDPEAPCDWSLLRLLHTHARSAQPEAALRIANLLACCEALRRRRLRLRAQTPRTLSLPAPAPASSSPVV